MLPLETHKLPRWSLYIYTMEMGKSVEVAGDGVRGDGGGVVAV